MHGNACVDSELSRYPCVRSARMRACVPQCREHLRSQRTQKGAGDTRACVLGTRARAPAPTERSASHALSLTDRPLTRSDPSRVRINLFQITLSRRSSSGSYKYQVPQENTSKDMKHLAIFRNLTLISGTYLREVPEMSVKFSSDWYQIRANQYARYETRCGMHKPCSTWFGAGTAHCEPDNAWSTGRETA